MRFVRDFMLVLGPVSSLFDFLTFCLLLLVFHAGEALFQTGWFIEPLATQVLVIFVLRTRGNLLRSVPHLLLTGAAVAVMVTAVTLPFTPIGAWFGFVPLPGVYWLFLAAILAAYLVMTQFVKSWFVRRFGLL